MRVLLVDAFPMVRADHRPVGAGIRRRVRAGRRQRRCGLGRLGPARARCRAAGPGGLELLQRIAREGLPAPVLVISGGDDVAEALRIVVGLGAMGYVPERSDMATLAHALRLMLAGGIHVPPLKPSTGGEPAAELTVPDWPTLPLTPRQKDVLRLLTQGLPNKLIARELGVSVETVKDHVAAILKAMGVSSRTQAVVAATRKP